MACPEENGNAAAGRHEGHGGGDLESPVDGETAVEWQSVRLPRGEDDESGLSSESEYELHEGQETLLALPAHLKLPTELELRILELAEFTWKGLWLDIRPLCKSWSEHVESLARRKWLRRAYLHFPYKRFITGRTAGPSYWDFERLEDDGTAVFRDVKNAPSDEKIVTHCKRVARPDVVLGHSVFKINIPGLVLDYDALSVRVPWRAFVARVFAEERAVRVEQYKIALGALDGPPAANALDALQRAYSGWEDAHTIVHKSRAENANDGPRELRRLDEMRGAIMWQSIDSDDEPAPGVLDIDEAED